MENNNENWLDLFASDVDNLSEDDMIFTLVAEESTLKPSMDESNITRSFRKIVFENLYG